MATIRTHQGKRIDMEMLVQSNQHVPAITGGGARMNARGDILGQNGQVIKTKEQIEEEYMKNPGTTVKQVSMNQLNAKFTSKNKKSEVAVNNEPEIKTQVGSFLSNASPFAARPANPTTKAPAPIPVAIPAIVEDETPPENFDDFELPSPEDLEKFAQDQKELEQSKNKKGPSTKRKLVEE